MRVLISGGAGFIGSHVAEHYIAAGHEVAIADDLSTGHRENVPSGAKFYECDIRSDDFDRVVAEFRPSIINHHAAQMSVRLSIASPRHDASINVDGSLNLLEASIRHGVSKVIYASTGGALYGEPEYLPCDEGHPIAPLCHYGVSKHTVEHYLELYAQLYGLDYTALRYANVYGPRQDPDGEAGVIAIFIGRLLDGQPVVIFGDGEQTRDFVHVDDIARANVLALEAASRRILNLGSGTGTSVNQIYADLKEITGSDSAAVHEPARLGEVMHIYLDSDRARDVLGWSPQVAWEDGLRATVQSFAQA